MEFAGFLRISELLNIRRSDIVFHDNCISLFVEKTKTYRYREGSYIVKSCKNEVSCLVRMLMVFCGKNKQLTRNRKIINLRQPLSIGYLSDSGDLK